MKRIITITFLCFINSLIAQQEVFKKGALTDSVKVNTTSKETFAIYLPKSFNKNKPSPIVFIYEPMARGKVGITPFIKASEKYGHILVCSNNSRNGLMNKNFEIADRLFNKIFSIFNIDSKLMYTAGFSGGARLASTIATISNQFAGVIACGGGFSSYFSLMENTLDFSYAAIIGDEDMNLLELYKTKDYITKLNMSNELFVHEIHHRWPTQDQILEAFDWLEIEAIKKGISVKNDILIKDIYHKYYKKAKKLEHNNKLLYASEEYQRIVRTFNPYFNLDSISNRLIALNNNEDLKKTKRKLKPIFEREIKLRNLFSERFANDLDKKKKNLKWWIAELGKLKSEQKDANSYKSKMINRLLYNTFSMAIEKTIINSESISKENLIFCFDICILVYPKYHFPYFKQVENYLSINDQSKALDYLEKLLKTGYSNIDLIKKEKTFQLLKNNERFKKLIKS